MGKWINGEMDKKDLSLLALCLPIYPFIHFTIYPYILFLSFVVI